VANIAGHRLIAIMIGRLKMDVDEAIQAYLKFSSEIFGVRLHQLPASLTGAIQPRYNSTKLRDAIATIVAAHIDYDGGENKDAVLNDGAERGCHT
jgi:hypothetical protein